MPILPIDAGRYITSEMRRIFDEEAYLQRLLDVEASLASAWSELGLYPKKYAKTIPNHANINQNDSKMMPTCKNIFQNDPKTIPNDTGRISK